MQTTIFDNGGKTVDRYTVLFHDRDEVWILSDQPTELCVLTDASPVIVADYLEESPEDREIPLCAAPYAVQQAVKAIQERRCA